MARTKRLTKTTLVKLASREHLGSPPPTRSVPNRKRKPEKHRPTLNRLLNTD